MTREPDITVVIPTRDRWDLLSTAALPAALRQEEVDLEVIVVDDGSRDETAARLGELDDPRLRVVRHEAGGGVAHARNAGLALARGGWTAFLDDDDVWSPRKLRAQLDAASAQGASFVYAAVIALDEHRVMTYGLTPPEPSEIATKLLSRNVLWGGCSNVMVRTDVLRRLSGFDERLFQLCDWDLWIRLASAERGALCPDVLVGCLVHPRSMLLTSEADVFAELEYLAAKHRWRLEGGEVEIDRALFTRWVAQGHRRAGRRGKAFLLYLRGAIEYRDPANAGRAVGSVLGERAAASAIKLARRLGARSAPPGSVHEEPDWVSLYRPPSHNALASLRAKWPIEV